MNDLKEKTIQYLRSYGCYIRTETKPAIYWMPHDHNDKILELIKEQKVKLEENIRVY